MIKKIAVGLFLTTGLFWMILQSNPAPFGESQEYTDPDPWESKHEPDDQFMMQRAWPDTAFDMKAYTYGVQEALQALATRGPESFPGDWKVEGPGNIGARINTIAVDPTNQQIIYVGFGRGGVWKTTNLGQNWVPVFDDQPFQAIGDIEIDPQNPNVIYVGTGDPNISGYPAIGDGVYKSIDGGQTWTHLGLTETRICSKVLVDPSNSDIVYVATMGLPFEPNSDRGLYKSVDGGLSWEQILFFSYQSGVCDLLIDPQNPATLYAAGWDRIRNNYQSIVTGPASKIWKTTDGGQNWTTLTGGLPQEDLGRIGLAMSGTNSSVIFAEYIGTNSQLFGIFKSTNGGQSWQQLPTDEDLNGLSANALGGFGWYFAKIRVNPQNDNDILILGVDVWRTTNSGQSWYMETPPWWTYEVHADKHDLVFGAAGGNYVYLLATDGGLYMKSDQQFIDMENIPASQFYRVAYNPHVPQNYYGGMQDNGSSGGNASNINDWPRIYGGDGFQMAFHPDEPTIFFAETQYGNIRMTLDGGNSFSTASIQPGDADRKNWDMPFLISSHDPNVLYSGTYKAYKGAIYVAGETVLWDSISTDLTKGILTEPTYHTISTLDESPVIPGLLYYGTSDGLLSRTDDDGETWEIISTDLPDRYVTSVKASPVFADQVYVCHSGYKWGEYIPRIHRSLDRGVTWEDISGDLPDLAINDVYIFPMHEDSIIFVGTDGGVYGTVDAGTTWGRVGDKMPIIPVYDLTINPSENTLVAGTFARSIMSYPLDSIQLYMMEDTIPTAIKVPVEKDDKLLVYPNPASDEITIEFQHTEGGGKYELVILDQIGRMIRLEERETRGYEKLSLDINELPVGAYVVKVKMRHHVLSGKFIKQG